MKNIYCIIYNLVIHVALRTRGQTQNMTTIREILLYRNVLGSLLFLCILLALVCSALIHTLVFVINWEDWFFGIKLAGPAAGAWLFAKAACATGIIILMVGQSPSRRTAAFLCTLYFGVLFLNSLVTFLGMEGYGFHAAFPVLPPALFGLAVAYWTIQTLTPVTDISPG